MFRGLKYDDQCKKRFHEKAVIYGNHVIIAFQEMLLKIKYIYLNWWV